MKKERVIISFHTFVAQQSESISKEKNMNDSEDTSGSSITALIVFRENGDAGNLFVPVLCDAIRMTGVDVRCSTKEFWESDTQLRWMAALAVVIAFYANEESC